MSMLDRCALNSTRRSNPHRLRSRCPECGALSLNRETTPEPKCPWACQADADHPWMTLTLTPSRLPSWESALEKFPIAALTDAPMEKSAAGERAAPPPILTTEPWAALSVGQNNRHIRTQPKNFSA